MDWMHGELLIYRVKDHSQIDRDILLGWMQQLLEQLIQYHQCYNDQNYKYLNPYSVLVARDGQLLLLDLEAKSNEFVMRNLQKRAMRAHFVKPVMNIMEGTGDMLDLYGYGKTIQFILANTNAEPSLTGSQERRLEKIIQKCLNENSGKRYKELKQVMKDIPVIRNRKVWEKKKELICAAAAAAGIFLAAGSCGAAFQLNREQNELKNWIWKLEQQQKAEQETDEIEEVKEMIQDIEEKLREEIKIAKDSVDTVSGLLEEHLNEEELEKIENENKAKEVEADNGEKSENSEEPTGIEGSEVVTENSEE